MVERKNLRQSGNASNLGSLVRKHKLSNVGVTQLSNNSTTDVGPAPGVKEPLQQSQLDKDQYVSVPERVSLSEY